MMCFTTILRSVGGAHQTRDENAKLIPLGAIRNPNGRSRADDGGA
jgi:hypothetical protein